MSESKRLAMSLNFAAGLLETHKKARFQMGQGGGSVWRVKVVAGLPGIVLNDGDVWISVTRLTYDILKRCKALSLVE